MIIIKLRVGASVRRDDPLASYPTRVGVGLDLGDRLHFELRRRAEYDRLGFRRSRERGGLYTSNSLCVGPLTLALDRRHLTYGEAVGAPRYLHDPALDWVINEFDESFNALAIASLKYHCDWSIADIGDQRRAEFQQLIERLSEAYPEYSDAEQAVFDAAGERLPEPEVGGPVTMRPFTPEERKAHEAWRVRELEWQARIDAARHYFVDVMGELWS